MQSSYAARFERDVGSTEAEWLARLPAAIGAHRWECEGRRAEVDVGSGRLHLWWEVAEPRVIALVRMPRLRVSFDFGALGDAERLAFMKRFDLYMQRGGG